jgi:hypothetical protein
MGPWRADRTADVAMQLPRTALRADHRDPPDRPGPGGAPILAPSLAARVPPLFTWPNAEPGPHGLVVHNRGRARSLVVVGGAPAGWVDPGATVELEGWRAGVYQVGALRPLGGLGQRAQRVRIPGELTLVH